MKQAWCLRVIACAVGFIVLPVACQSAENRGADELFPFRGWATLCESDEGFGSRAITVSGNGAVFSVVLGQEAVISSRGWVDPNLISALFAAIWTPEFLALKTSYRMPVNDGRAITVTVCKDGVYKTVAVYGVIGDRDALQGAFPGIVDVDLMPYLAIERIAGLIDRVLEEVRWK